MRGLAGIKEASVRLPVNATTAKGGCAGKEVRTVGWCGEGMDTGVSRPVLCLAENAVTGKGGCAGKEVREGFGHGLACLPA